MFVILISTPSTNALPEIEYIAGVLSIVTEVINAEKTVLFEKEKALYILEEPPESPLPEENDNLSSEYNVEEISPFFFVVAVPISPPTGHIVGG